MSRACHAERAVPDAWRHEYRAEDDRGVGAHASGLDEARIVLAETLRVMRAIRTFQRDARRALDVADCGDADGSYVAHKDGTRYGDEPVRG
jgi:hypothetical protein